MGVVYRATDPVLDRQVAVKVIAARTAAVPLSGEELEARFVREARMASRISHPGVVTIHDAGREGDLLFLVMELVEGESLAARLARGDRPAPDEALEIGASVADALAAAHALGIVHRDVKPGNIVLGRDGRLKVADFGVAKAIGEDTNLTRTGTVVGSPAYMSPEQVRGDELDARSDLFSLGVVLYELLLRRRPFPADTVTSLIYQILHEDPLADPKIARALGPETAGFLGRCLAKERERRIPDAATLAAGARALAAALRATAAETTAPTARLAVRSGGPSPSPGAPAVAEAPASTASAFPLAAVLTGLGVALFGLAALVGLRQLGRRPAAVQPVVPAAAAPTAAPPARATAPSRGRIPDPAAGGRGAAPAAAALTGAQRHPAEPEVVAIFYCRRGAEFNVSPEEAVVSVGGKVIGKADDWDGRGGGQTYVFPHPGRYLVNLSLAGYRETWIAIVVDPAAPDEIADVDTALPEK
jgi:serine/threonine-protein kinase